METPETGFLLTPKMKVGDEVTIHLNDEQTQNLRIQTKRQLTKGMQHGKIASIDRATGRYTIQPPEGPVIELPFNLVDHPDKKIKKIINRYNPKSLT